MRSFLPTLPRMSARRLAGLAVVALATAGALPAAQARGDITWSIGISSGGVYGPPAPVYLPPPPVVVHPRTIYLPPAPVVVQPAPVIVQPPVYGVYYERWPAWRRAEWARHHGWRHHDRRGGEWGRGGERN